MLRDIYDYIMKTFPYYGQLKKQKCWQNSVRHNLSVHKLFVRSELIPGKPNFWTLNPEYDSNMKDLLFLKTSDTLSKEGDNEDNSSKSLECSEPTDQDNEHLTQVETEQKQVSSDPLNVQANGHKVEIKEEIITE